MQETIKIVNDRVASMLNAGEGNSMLFFQDVRTLTELVRTMLEKEEGGE